ncbi:mannose-6-phosphate receptor binding domain-containing protein [Mrakia frigida]|uniref:Mrl1p n=1 Tax=Mrakia frigida TaxID=29902 RepID=UPI003FCC1514
MASSCSVQSGSTVWDLSSLANNNEDYTWTSSSGEKIVLNVCRSIVTEVFGIEDPDQVGAFVQGDKGDRSIGSILSNLTLTNSSPPSPVLLFPNGASCSGSSSLLSSTLIHFTCSTAAESTGPELLGTLPPGEDVGKACAYVFEWKTPAACPKSVGSHAILGDWGAVGVLVGLSLLILLAYFLGTVLYNRYILKLRGSAQLPHFTCSTPSISLPSLSNPFKRSSSSSSQPWGSWRRGNGYGRVPAEARDDEQGDSDEEEGLVGRFGLDSDDDDEDARALDGDSRVWRSQGTAATNSAGAGGAAKTGGGAGLISL